MIFSSSSLRRYRMSSDATTTTTAKERAWHPPAGLKQSAGGKLQLLNSLVDKKVPFVPAAGPESRNITWYTCGTCEPIAASQ